MLPLRNSERMMIAMEHTEANILGSKSTKLVAVKETDNHYLPETTTVGDATKFVGELAIGCCIGYAVSALVIGALYLIF